MSMCYNPSTLVPFLCFLWLTIFVSHSPVSSDDSLDKVLFRFRYKVHIVNGFPNNDSPLLISCHSNDDDLGNHTLWKDQEFRFEFKIHFVRKTHFVCNFDWQSKSLHDIRVFLNGVETHSCKQTGNCFWQAAPDGIYFSNHLGDWEKRFSW